MFESQSNWFFVFQLMSRGISAGQIDSAMKKMVGNDWSEVGTSAWISRLREKGYIGEDARELSADELEALVRGSSALERLGSEDD